MVHKSWKALWDEDLVPYRVLARQLPFVMVAHCAYPEVTGDAVPASISKKWIGDVLRKKIGYTGLVVSDDLEMGGVLKVASIEEAAVGTVQAGADMYLVCHNEELVHRAYEAILKEAERSRRFRTKVETAAQRILAAKRRWPALTARMAAAPSEAAVNRLRQKVVGVQRRSPADDERKSEGAGVREIGANCARPGAEDTSVAFLFSGGNLHETLVGCDSVPRFVPLSVPSPNSRLIRDEGRCAATLRHPEFTKVV